MLVDANVNDIVSFISNLTCSLLVNMKATKCCILALYPTILLWSSISPNKVILLILSDFLYSHVIGHQRQFYFLLPNLYTFLPPLFFFFKVILTTQSSLQFHMNCRMIFSICEKTWVIGIFIEINFIVLGSIITFTILSP